MTWGANGNHAKVQWAGPGGGDMIVFHGTKGNGSRCLYFEKFNLDGNGYAGAPCGSCLKLSAPDGDPGSIYKFTLRDRTAKHTKVDENFAALVNIQPTYHAGACLPQNQATNYYASGTER